MPQIFTASWKTELSDAFVRVGVSRGVPRRFAGFRRMRDLEPGPWFRSVGPARFLELYADILARLDPREVRDLLFRLGERPVLLCWESAVDCHLGRSWCHRHIIAQWLEDRLGIVVPEVGHPNLDRFRVLRELGLPSPTFQDPEVPTGPNSFR
jgi:hypothetical protein